MAKHHRPVEPPQTRILPPAHISAAVRLVVTKDQATNTKTVNIDGSRAEAAERKFPADGAIVRERLGHPEILLAQLNPFNHGKILRAIALRYDVKRFVQRVADNEQFRQSMIHTLEENRPRIARGEIAKLIEQADASEASVAVLHVEAEWATTTQERGMLEFVTINAGTLRRINTGKTENSYAIIELEASMPLVAMADLFDAWKDLADRMAKT